MINATVILLAELFSLITKFIFFDNLLTPRNRNLTFTYICWGMYFLIDNVISYFSTIPAFTYILIYYILTYILLSTLYNNTVLKKLLIMSFLYIAGIISEFCVVEVGLLMGLPLNAISIGGEFSFLFIFASRLLYFSFIRIFMHINQTRRTTNSSISEWFSIILIPLSSSLTLIALAAQETLVNIVVSIMLLISNLTNYFVYVQIQRKAEDEARILVLEEQKHVYVSQYNNILQLWNDNRSFRHELKNQYLYENHLLECQEYEKLKNLYKNSIDLLDSKRLYVSTGLSALDSLLNYKLSYAHSKGIKTGQNIQIEHFNMEETDYYTLFGNLLDNAIEGNLIVPEELRSIILTIKESASTLYIHIENPCDENSLQFYRYGFISTKSDPSNHGVGLSLVNSIIQKYQGKLDITTKTNLFIVDILLFLK